MFQPLAAIMVGNESSLDGTSRIAVNYRRQNLHRKFRNQLMGVAKAL